MNQLSPITLPVPHVRFKDGTSVPVGLGNGRDRSVWWHTIYLQSPDGLRHRVSFIPQPEVVSDQLAKRVLLAAKDLAWMRLKNPKYRFVATVTVCPDIWSDEGIKTIELDDLEAAGYALMDAEATDVQVAA